MSWGLSLKGCAVCMISLYNDCFKCPLLIIITCHTIESITYWWLSSWCHTYLNWALNCWLSELLGKKRINLFIESKISNYMRIWKGNFPLSYTCSLVAAVYLYNLWAREEAILWSLCHNIFFYEKHYITCIVPSLVLNTNFHSTILTRILASYLYF